MRITYEKLQEVIESLDWGVTDESCPGRKIWNLNICSNAGEDFNFSAEGNSVHDMIHDIKQYAADFDPDEHAEGWVLARQNGCKGIPSVTELVHDAESLDSFLQELSVKVNEFEDISISEDLKCMLDLSKCSYTGSNSDNTEHYFNYPMDDDLVEGRFYPMEDYGEAIHGICITLIVGPLDNQIAISVLELNEDSDICEYARLFLLKDVNYNEEIIAGLLRKTVQEAVQND